MDTEQPKQPIDAYTSARSDKPSKARKVALADVLWTAANKWLLTRNSHDGEPPLEYSCNAAQVAEAGRYKHHMFLNREGSFAVKFLEELGCNTGCATVFSGQHDVQGVRYMWLLLAMHVAEDEGIQIEVPA
jgi:hypothetical protein